MISIGKPSTVRQLSRDSLLSEANARHSRDGQVWAFIHLDPDTGLWTLAGSVAEIDGLGLLMHPNALPSPDGGLAVVAVLSRDSEVSDHVLSYGDLDPGEANGRLAELGIRVRPAVITAGAVIQCTGGPPPPPRKSFDARTSRQHARSSLASANSRSHSLSVRTKPSRPTRLEERTVERMFDQQRQDPAVNQGFALRIID